MRNIMKQTSDIKVQEVFPR